MTTSAEAFAKRRQGDVDEAYRMALELMGAPQPDDWDRKAFCWCLIDLVKRDASSGKLENLPHYRSQLQSVETDPSDDVLAKGIRNALALCNPGGREISQAKALSKAGRHAEAVAAYRKALAQSQADREAQTGFGWELFKHSKELMAAENVNIGAVKRNLNDYLKLDVEKPSLLHACVLQLAAKLARQDKFSMLVFSRLWNLEYLRPEEFERYRAEDGKEYPSLAERVIQQAGKEAAASDNEREQEYILPYIDAAIERFPDNVWLKLDKAKVLLSLGMHAEAWLSVSPSPRPNRTTTGLGTCWEISFHGQTRKPPWVATARRCPALPRTSSRGKSGSRLPSACWRTTILPPQSSKSKPSCARRRARGTKSPKRQRKSPPSPGLP
jgi:tetratricopeptide (TPR) repeat protein